MAKDGEAKWRNPRNPFILADHWLSAKINRNWTSRETTTTTKIEVNFEASKDSGEAANSSSNPRKTWTLHVWWSRLHAKNGGVFKVRQMALTALISFASALFPLYSDFVNDAIEHKGETSATHVRKKRKKKLWAISQSHSRLLTSQKEHHFASHFYD